jgi:hypothetical protein
MTTNTTDSSPNTLHSPAYISLQHAKLSHFLLSVIIHLSLYETFLSAHSGSISSVAINSLLNVNWRNNVKLQAHYRSQRTKRNVQKEIDKHRDK